MEEKQVEEQKTVAVGEQPDTQQQEPVAQEAQGVAEEALQAEHEAQAEQEPAAGSQLEAEPKMTRRERAKAILHEHFSAPRLAYMAIFTALAFIVTFLEFPIFPGPAGFLKLDFANVFFLFEGFIFGPVEAFVSIVIKELLCFAKSSSGGVGEVANLIMSTAYIIIPSIAYRFKRGKWWVCLYLFCACALQVGISLVVNCYINFPFFTGSQAAGQSMFAQLWTFVLYFNIIKSVAVSVVVFFVYKPLSKLIKMTTDKFDKRMQRIKEKRKEKAREKSSEKTE